MPVNKCLHCGRPTPGETRRGGVCITCQQSAWMIGRFTCVACGTTCTRNCWDNHWGGLVEDPYSSVIELCKACYRGLKSQIESRGLEKVPCSICKKTTAFKGIEVCLSCMKITSPCQACDTKVKRDDLKDYHGLYICPKCYSSRIPCSKCKNLFLPRHLSKYECKPETIFCSECRRYYQPIHDYSYKPEPHFSPNPYNHKDLYMGVELEIDRRGDRGNYDMGHEPLRERPSTRVDKDGVAILGSNSKDNSAMSIVQTGGGYVYIKSDSSLMDGFEVVSHPATLSDHKNKLPWKSILSSCIKEGYQSHNTETCGIHVHTNRDFLTRSEQVKLGMFFSMNYILLARFARRYHIRQAPFKKLIVDDVTNEATRSFDRHEAINWRNKDTIEIRIFKGTLKYETFMAILEFIHFLLHFLKEINSKELMEKEQIWGRFMNYLKLYKKDARELLEYLSQRRIDDSCKFLSSDKGHYEMNRRELDRGDHYYIDYRYRENDTEDAE